MKTCTKCGETKPLDEYYRNNGMRDGRLNTCKKCSAEYSRTRNTIPEVKARRAETTRVWREENREHVRARQAEYDKWHYQENRERKRDYWAEYYEENKVAILEQRAEYRSRPEVKARNSEYMRNYQAENMHLWWEYDYGIRAIKYGFDPVVESFTKEDLTARWGNECFHCKGEWAELDHWPIPIVRGGHHVIENCRPSCAPCNWKSWRQDV